MPWSETCAMDERMRFIVAASEDDAVMSAVCAEFGISRETGYKWLARYREEGVEGLKERSRAPARHGRARDGALVEAALALRERHPTWGPKKLRRKLVEGFPGTPAPAASTIGDWLSKEGLTQPRRARRRCPPYSSPFLAADAPNAVWCVDFKGWFPTGDGKRCDPLTISDAMSRYLLHCQAVARTDGAHVRPAFEAAFCAFGLPLAIRSDNGPPFASVGAGGLSQLAVWWIKLGVTPERIERGKPQQNGRHERECQIFCVSSLCEGWRLAGFGVSRTRPSKAWRARRADRRALSRPSAAGGGGRRPALTGLADRPNSRRRVRRLMAHDVAAVFSPLRPARLIAPIRGSASRSEGRTAPWRRSIRRPVAGACPRSGWRGRAASRRPRRWGSCRGS